MSLVKQSTFEAQRLKKIYLYKVKKWASLVIPKADKWTSPFPLKEATDVGGISILTAKLADEGIASKNPKWDSKCILPQKP